MGVDIRRLREEIEAKKISHIFNFLKKVYPNSDLKIEDTGDYIVFIKPLDGNLAGIGEVIKAFLKFHERGTIVLRALPSGEVVYYFIPYPVDGIEEVLNKDFSLRLSDNNLD